ncbi:PAS domain S-box protein [Euzebyella marina]|uniref:histidine kinase n=2 Tax=Euzebyella marina TaxID=1761453 RepID=A0A3G2L5R0_9FLAO|nr:PAS domain S-box protein [Euzebyella marina]
MTHTEHDMLPSFLQGGGEMATLIAAKDWTTHKLGKPETWPLSLKISLSNMLKSAFPKFIWWESDLYCFYNDAYRPSLGTEGKHPSIIGEKAKNAWPEIWHTIEPMIREVLSTGNPIFRENQLIPINRNGRIENVYWTFSYSALMGDDEKINGVLVTCSETTNAVLNLKRLEESEDLLKFSVDAAELGTWDYNPKTHKFQGNKRLKDWFGISNKMEIDLPIALNAILPQDRQRVESKIQKALNGENDGKYDVVYSIENKTTKEIKIVRALGRSWFNEAGEAYRFNGILQDVTEQEKAAEQLRYANLQIKTEKERFENIVRNAPTGIAMFKGPQLVVEMANPTFLNFINKKPHQLVGKKLYSLFPGIEERVSPLFNELFKSRESVRGKEFLMPVKRNGKIEQAYFNFILHPINGESDDLLEIMLITNEVTDYVVAQNDLKEKETQFKNLVLQSPVAKAIFRGSDLRIEMANNKMLSHFWGKAWKEIAGKRLIDVFPELEGQKYIEILKDVIRTGKSTRDYNSQAIVNINGQQNTFYVNYVYLPLREIDGSVSGVMITVTDVSNEYYARQKLIHFSKELENQVEQRTHLLNKANADLEKSIKQLEKANDELESFAYVSSHDLQEPLRKIQMFTSRIMEREGDSLSDKGKGYFHKITESAKRMRSLIDDLLAFSRADDNSFKFEAVDLNTILNQIIEDRSEYIDIKKAEVKYDRLPIVIGVPFQLRQVFDNLIGNSLKFSKENEIPKIQVSYFKCSSREINKLELNRNLSYAKIQVTDNGIGFPSGMENKIFEVFQRSHHKTKYGGTGIGLAIVKKIVLAHNGAIVASSKVGNGASFTLYLPME